MQANKLGELGLSADWDTELSVQLTPEEFVHTIFHLADSVHTGASSCIDNKHVHRELTALADKNDNFCRLVEQEYFDDEDNQVRWCDWTVEIRVQSIFISAHWRANDNDPPTEWQWRNREAEKAFQKACLFMGKRVRRGLVIESAPKSKKVSHIHH